MEERSREGRGEERGFDVTTAEVSWALQLSAALGAHAVTKMGSEFATQALGRT